MLRPARRWPIRARVLFTALVVALLVGVGVLLRNSGLFTQPTVALRYIGSGHWVTMPAEPTAFEKTTEGFVYRGTTGNFIDDNVYALGAYERPELYLLRDLLTDARGSEGVFLDIGANVGQHALFMANHAATVHAVEPFPPVLKLFDNNLAANDFDNVVIHRVGFSNEPGSLPFFAPPDSNLGTGSFDGEFSDDNAQAMELPLVVGDDHLDERGVERIDLIKVDIEGFERYALQGLDRTLRRDRPIVVMELNNAEGGFANQSQIDATFPEGYQLFEIEPPTGGEDIFGFSLFRTVYFYGPRLMGEYVTRPFTGDYEEQRNVVAAPGELVERLGLGGGAPGG